MENTTTVILVTAIAIAAILIAAWFVWRGWRSRKLKERFGPEYERTLQATGDRHEAEKNLAERRKRVEEYELRSLTPEERVRFSREWDEIQRQFVDSPGTAVESAQLLVDRVMEARGYPIGDAHQQQEDVSVEAPEVVVHYRKAREIALRSEKATTEELRLATKHYRSLFRTLLESGEEPEPATGGERRESEVQSG